MSGHGESGPWPGRAQATGHALPAAGAGGGGRRATDQMDVRQEALGRVTQVAVPGRGSRDEGQAPVGVGVQDGDERA